VYQRAVRALPLLLALLGACASAPAPRPAAGSSASAEAAAGEVLDRFAGAVGEGRWDEAWTLLSARWRSRSTPARLAQDFRASGPVGPEAAARVRALRAGGAAPTVAGGEASLVVGEGRRARLVAEEGGWRLDALE